MLKKYLPFFKANLMMMITYRSSVLAWYFVETFSVVMMIFLWSTIYKNQPDINGYSVNEIIIYFLIVGILRIFASNYAIDIVSDEVKQGQISMYLIKPINYKTRVFFSDLGNRFGIIMIMLPVSILVMYLISIVWDLSFSFDMLNFGLLIAFLPLIFMLMFEFSYLFGLISIYTTNVFGLVMLFNIIISITSGQLIPLSFYPDFLFKIVNLLPFKYVYHFPANILLGEIQSKDALSGALILIIWICFFKVINYFFFKFSLKKIVIFGG